MFDLASYQKAHTVEEAIAQLEREPRAKPLAGGTDIFVRLREGHADYRHVVDIHDLAELKQITLEADGTLRIGSGVTFSALIDAPLIRERIPVLAEGALSVGGPQVRESATVGGNICNGAPSADSAAPLLVLGAVAELTGPDGVRRLPVEAFYEGPGKVDRRPAEILTALSVASADYEGWGAAYLKYAMRDAMDIATIGCAGACRVEGGRVAGLRLAYTVAGPTPLRCRKTEAAVEGMTVDGNLIDRARELVLGDLMPRDSWRAAKDFREHIIRTLAEKVLRKITGLADA